MPSEVSVRPATAADEPALRRLDLATADPGTYVAAPQPASPFFAGSTRPADVLVAELDGQVVGWAKVVPPTPLASNAHVQQLQGLGVDPAVRRRGVASALLAAAVELARRRGARRLTLRVLGSNPGAQALYRSAGFVVEGVLRGEFRLGDGRYVDDVLMALPL